MAGLRSRVIELVRQIPPRESLKTWANDSPSPRRRGPASASGAADLCSDWVRTSVYPILFSVLRRHRLRIVETVSRLRILVGPLASALMKRAPKGLKGFKEISESEELKAFLPPGSQITPGPYGGTTIMIPYPGGFSPRIPEFRGPWAKFREEIYRFEVLASCDGRTPMPRAKKPGKTINALCDQWIMEFYQDKDRWNRTVPKEIAPWLIARATMATTFAAMDDTHGIPAPEIEIEKFMCEVLIDLWNDGGGQENWHGFHPDASNHAE
ncbi:MAG: hypothetical protein JWM68_1625 [Verrucomicrobiales bacterium]|nr:hypothetical protein [Verrucomicrobiales bacterium]